MALGSKEGIASCLLLKLHILQIIKYAEDPLDSDSDGETLEGEAPDSKQGNSKIQNVFEQFYHYMNMCNSRAVYPKIERIINYVKQFQKTEEVLNFTKNEAMLKFLFRPVLSSEIGKGEETPRKSHRKLSDPSTERKSTPPPPSHLFYSLTIPNLRMDKGPHAQAKNFTVKIRPKCPITVRKIPVWDFD